MARTKQHPIKDASTFKKPRSSAVLLKQATNAAHKKKKIIIPNSIKNIAAANPDIFIDTVQADPDQHQQDPEIDETAALASLLVKKSRKPYRFHPGTVARREIIKLQKSTKSMIRKAPFDRLVRECAQDQSRSELRFQKKAIEALQDATEAYADQLFQDCTAVAANSNRVTVYPKDMTLVRRMHGWL